MKFIKKIELICNNFMTGKSGFSLVELIVVIAIMAVMAAVLAPALLGYVEKSRMQKDDSAMDEVVNAMKLSLADQEIYDEVLEHSVWDNVSCYIDKKDESQFSNCKVQLKAEHGDKKEQYMFGDEARLLDETVYYAAGNMRGLTITFSPSKSGDTYDFANGILNKFVGRKTGLLSENPELYNRLRSVIGDKLDTTSQTYRNSDYTIFIRVGSTGGSEAVMQDAIQVWGQFNGTNLSEKDHKYELSSGRVVGAAGQNDNAFNQQNNQTPNIDFGENSDLTKKHNVLIPVGGKYTIVTTSEVLIGDGQTVYFPETTLNGDEYEFGNYVYKYNYRQSLSMDGWIFKDVETCGWGVAVKSRNLENYGELLVEINHEPITYLQATFRYCENLKQSPVIPETVVTIQAAFYHCSELSTTPTIPQSVVNMINAFNSCSSLTHAPIIPSNVQRFNYAFAGCSSMSGTIIIHANPTEYINPFVWSGITDIQGNTSMRDDLLYILHNPQ